MSGDEQDILRSLPLTTDMQASSPHAPPNPVCAQPSETPPPFPAPFSAFALTAPAPVTFSPLIIHLNEIYEGFCEF